MGVGLAKPVTDVPIEPKRLLIVIHCMPILALHPGDVPQTMEGVGLAKPVADVLVELQRLAVVLCRLPILTQQPDGVP